MLGRILTVLLCFLYVFPAIAQEPGIGTPAEDMESEYLDTVVLIDSSGSMLLIDPDRARDEAVVRYTGFLGEGDRLGIISFGNDAVIQRPLKEFSPEQSSSLLQQLHGIAADGEYTDIFRGLQVAASMMLAEVRPLTERSIILISDGKMDPPKSKGPPATLTDKLFKDTIPSLKEKEIKVHTIAIGEQADRLLLERIASESDGSFWFARDANNIYQGLAELFADTETVQAEKSTRKGFRVEGEIPEATFYVHAEDISKVSLLSPDGVQYTRSASNNARWFRGKKFDVITIEKPKPGVWEVLGLSKNNGFATLLTNLKLVTSFPQVFEAGEKVLLQARMYDSRIPVVLPRMTNVVRYSSSITPTDRVSEPVYREFLSDEGEDGDLSPNDGIFSNVVTLENPGEYMLETIAIGPTFERSQQLAFRVKPRLVSVRVVPGTESYLVKRVMEDSNADVLEIPPAVIQISLSAEASLIKKQRVTLLATKTGGKKFSLAVEKVSGHYEAPIYALPETGEYTLKAVFLGTGKKGKRLRGESLPLVYENTFTGGGDYQVVQTSKRAEVDDTPFEIPWWVYALLLTMINVGAGSYGLKELTELQAEIEDVEEDSTSDSIEDQRAFYEALKERAQATELDMEAPMFSDPAFEPLLIADLDSFEFAEDESEEGPSDSDQGGSEPGVEEASAISREAPNEQTESAEESTDAQGDTSDEPEPEPAVEEEKEE